MSDDLSKQVIEHCLAKLEQIKASADVARITLRNTLEGGCFSRAEVNEYLSQIDIRTRDIRKSITWGVAPKSFVPPYEPVLTDVRTKVSTMGYRYQSQQDVVGKDFVYAVSVLIDVVESLMKEAHEQKRNP